MNKKTILPLIFAGALLAASCSGRHGASAESDSDSVSETETEAPADTAAADTMPEYLSADLRAYRIKGPVSSRSEIKFTGGAPGMYLEPQLALRFDEEGKLTNAKEAGLDEIKTDKEGFNKIFKMHESDGTSWVMTYEELDSAGFPVKAVTLEDGPEGEARTTVTYSKYGFDSHGNWTVRRADCRYVFTDMETGEKSTETSSWKETCSYTYR